MDSHNICHYLIGPPAIGSHFFGRQNQIEQFFAMLGESTLHSMRIFGLPISGKTSFLRYIATRENAMKYLKGKCPPTIIAYVNLEAIKTPNDLGVFHLS